jgi:hypothetical protein
MIFWRKMSRRRRRKRIIKREKGGTKFRDMFGAVR